MFINFNSYISYVIKGTLPNKSFSNYACRHSFSFLQSIEKENERAKEIRKTLQ